MSWSLWLDPIPAEYFGDRVLILGVEGGNDALIVGEDGRLKTAYLTDLVTEWRYNWTDHKWHDVSVEEEHLYGETPDDGSTAIPGEVPEFDGAGDSDQGPELDGDPGDMDSDEEDRVVAGNTGLAR